MTYAIAAAGTGGHVYPGLAVGEALVDSGVSREDILYVGGDRLESEVFPREGFPFLPLELRGLARRLTLSNLTLPAVVMRATRVVREELRRREVAVVLGLGNYVTVPVAMAASRVGAALALSEQNAAAGLANRMMARRASRVFGAFPVTKGLPKAEWVGNPIRRSLSRFDRHELRIKARDRWGFDASNPVLGVFGGSLGAGVVNAAVRQMLEGWDGSDLQVLHLAGHGREEMAQAAAVSDRRWVVLDFCDQMEEFYAVCDLVIARAGGSVAELTATATPSVLIPGGFGSGGHQHANAVALEERGAAVVVSEEQVDTLPEVVGELLRNRSQLTAMASAAAGLAKPEAASAIAGALEELATR